MAKKGKTRQALEAYYARRVKKEISQSPWVLRITEHKDKPVPVLIVKERILPGQRTDTQDLMAPRSILKERGLIYGQPQVRCLPVIRAVLACVSNQAGIPLELRQFLNGRRILFRGNLPLNEESGCKLALIFKLHERIKDLDRIELIARRVDRFTREEAAYWLSRTATFGRDANRWALSGLRVMLGGQPGDEGVERMLEGLRHGG